MSAPFTPTLYLKQGCPFCFKLRLFLLEAGLEHDAKIVEVSTGSPEEEEVRALLSPHIEKISFPAAEIKAGRYLADSDALIRHFGRSRGVEPANLLLLQAFVAGPLKTLGELFRENRELKARLG